MPAIHLIQNDSALPQIKPVEPGSEVYRSGFWHIGRDTADSLIGGRIYFHERQAKPSFFGGIILAADIVEAGDYAGRVVFTFRWESSCKGVVTSQEHWGQEKKIVP